MSHICLIEDEEYLNKVLKLYIEREGHTVTSCYNLQGVYEIMEKEELFDLYVIDIMLPDGCGVEILKKIKMQTEEIPVILISARGDSIDRVLGFEMGCDDYIAKPFLPAELCYRISKLLKPQNQTHTTSTKKEQSEDTIQFGSYTMDTSARTICEKDIMIDVTSKEFDIILYFITHTSVAISREKLLNEIWGTDYFGYDRVVDNHIKNIRKKLPKFSFETIYGYGYRYTV